ncbi:hypothetical protein Zm00014a_025039 [Zea mays]|uniref:Histone deacetylase 6 n=1 Tax=Zea mays TaxID=4577 RepID=A0A3L6FLK1_MAIZE|nr:Histone deacetylase 6 [Zea mays]PWZ34082.1 hypothetical protein Zm00014a_025039 [Zea mays]
MSSAAGEDALSSDKGKKSEEDGTDGRSQRQGGVEVADGKVDLGDLYGAAAGWVEARTSCPHIGTLPPAGADDLVRVPSPDSPCSRCNHPAENWLCFICKDVLCSRFINKHMLCHHQETGHCLALSFSDLSVWCFSCDSYLDVQAILELRPVYEVAHLLKFGHRPPFRSLDVQDSGTGESGSVSRA